MFAYIARRLGVLVVILFGSSFILYNLAAVAGDPTEELRFDTSPEAKQQLIALTRDLQLNVPPPLRYFIWLRGVLGLFIGQPDFGDTRTAQSVTDALSAAIPVTIRLVIMATIIAILLGITIGIATALRQYSRFDYSMTFVSFLFFSLPIFWVAVLLKQYLAIEFNNFLYEAKVSNPWLIGLAIFTGLFWASILGGDRRRVWTTFGVASVMSAGLLFFLSSSGWFQDPFMGPIGVAVFGTIAAFAITHLSMGLSNRRALHISLGMVALGTVIWFPAQSFLNADQTWLHMLGLGATTIAVGLGSGYFFSKVDRGAVMRTSTITAFVVALLIVIDKLFQTFRPYSVTDAVNYRPVPTMGEVNPLLESTDFWINFLDALTHLFLPTLALLLISFAGYVRFSRGTLLEVLNQDYIRTARAKGLPERTVIMRHAFRNTMIPIATIMVVDFAGVIGGAIITEQVFGWYGMGTLFNQAIGNFDLNLLMGVFFVTATMALMANLVADLLYSALDPRVRVGAGK